MIICVRCIQFDVAIKLFMTSLLAFFGTSTQLPLGMCIMTAYICIVLLFQPFGSCSLLFQSRV